MPPEHRIRLAPGYDPGLTDIGSSHPAYKYVQALANARYFVGYENKTFKPDQPITREEMIGTKVLIDTGKKGDDQPLNYWDFGDYEEIDPKYRPPIRDEYFFYDEVEGVTNPNTPSSNIRRAFGNIDYFNPKQAVIGYEAAATVWQFGDGKPVTATATGIVIEE